MKWYLNLILVIIPFLMPLIASIIVNLVDWISDFRKERLEKDMEKLTKECDDLREEIASDYIPWTCSVKGNSATLTVVDNSLNWISEPSRPQKRLYCEYCGCISEKEHGTCDHCGAPLKEMEE